MEQSQLMVVDATAAGVLIAAAVSILVPVGRRGPLRENRLDLTGALVLLSCGAGYAVRAGIGPGGGDSSGSGWLRAASATLTVVAAGTYLWLRRATSVPEEGGGLYEDACRRQHALAGQVMAAQVREELATERAAAAQQRLARVFAAAPVGMAVVDRRGCITAANPALDRIVGGDDAPETGSLEGVRLSDIVTPEDARRAEALLDEAGETSGGVELRIERAGDDGAWGRFTVTPFPGDDAARLVQVEDVSGRHAAEDRLEHLASHDPLTGLPNRLLLHNRAAAALRQANRTGCYVGCLFVDLDDFRAVNDSLGHAAGDRVLATTAARLIDVVRPGDTVARMGDDEFCLLLVGLEHQEEARIVAARVHRALDGFVDLDGTRVATSASVGVAVARPGERATSESLVRDADTALGRAQAGGGPRPVVVDPGLRADLLHLTAPNPS